jgi:hypothetical protein
MNLRIYKNYLKRAKRKKDKLMCAPLEGIRGKTPAEILRAVGLDNKFPVPLQPILEYLGIAATPYDFTELENSDELKTVVAEKGNILGLIISKDDCAGIFYRQDDKVHRQRFTIAHEIAHCAMADDLIEEFVCFRHDEISDNEKEIAVNTFAGELLIPKNALQKAYDALPVKCAFILSRAFAVSENVMKKRMKVLGLSYAE